MVSEQVVVNHPSSPPMVTQVLVDHSTMASAKEKASGTGSRVNKDPESLLRLGLPIKNKEVRLALNARMLFPLGRAFAFVSCFSFLQRSEAFRKLWKLSNTILDQNERVQLLTVPRKHKPC